jgi:hypothetical protein
MPAPHGPPACFKKKGNSRKKKRDFCGVHGVYNSEMSKLTLFHYSVSGEVIMKKLGMFAVLAVMLVAAAPAMGAPLTQTLPFQFPISPGSQTLAFDQFDMPGCTLLSVTLELDAWEGGNITAENDSTIAGSITVSMSGWATGTGPNLLATALLSQSAGPAGVAATDGVPGSGPDFHDFGYVSDSGSGTNSQSTNLAPYIGTGTVDIDIDAQGGWAFEGVTDATLQISDFEAWGDATIIYEYTCIPEPATIAMMVFGALGMFGVIRRKLK